MIRKRNMWTHRVDNKTLEEIRKMLLYKIVFLPPSKCGSAAPYDETDDWCDKNCSGLFLLANHKAAFEKKEDLASFILRWHNG